jgi:hypothetical protein
MTSEPVVVRIATSASQARVFVALLQAEGIPAHVEGDALADEVAVSRRLMNLNGVRVLVPQDAVDAAREILAASAIDERELEAQALSADAPEQPVRPREEAGRRSAWPLGAAVLAALVFLGLWLREVDARADQRHPLFDYEAAPGRLREILRSSGAGVRDFLDADGDRLFEEVRGFRAGGVVETWFDRDEDGVYEEGVVTDASGRTLQVVRWRDGVGFVIEPR